jgi:hypothetical protein
MQKTIYEIRCLLQLPRFKNKIQYLHKPYVLEWLFADPEYIKTLTPESEKKWGQSIISSKTNQWTTRLGESILHDILSLQNKNPSKIKNLMRGENGKRLDPDREADDGLYENKTRTFTVTGTAGEKILGTPLKYCECYQLYKKPLFIVCMAYQEQEAVKDFKLFDTVILERQQLIKYFEDFLHIKFIRATDMLCQFLYDNQVYLT